MGHQHALRSASGKTSSPWPPLDRLNLVFFYPLWYRDEGLAGHSPLFCPFVSDLSAPWPFFPDQNPPLRLYPRCPSCAHEQTPNANNLQEDSLRFTFLLSETTFL